MNRHPIGPIQTLYQFLKSKEILLAVFGFQSVKQAIGSIFCVANNEKYKVHLFEVVHHHQPCGQPQHSVVFILTGTIIKYYIQLTANRNVLMMREATLVAPFFPIPS
jgi:hypothetical protein